MKITLLLLLTGSFLFSCNGHTAKQNQSLVSDSANILTDAQHTEFNRLYKLHEEKTSNQIALLTIDHNKTDMDLHDYGKVLFNKRGVGQRGKNNGLLILFCMKCKRLEILSGRGTEKILTDSLAKGIIDNFMIPKFRIGKYYDGILDGSNAIISFLEKPGNEIK